MAERVGRSTLSRRTNERFARRMMNENGGELPEDLKGPDGGLRLLTAAPSDDYYRQAWLAAAREERGSRAVQKPISSAKCPCQSAGQPPAVATAAGPQREICKHQNLTLKCMGRERQLKVPAPLPLSSGKPTVRTTLDILAGPRQHPTHVTATAQAVGPCKRVHAQGVVGAYPDLSITKASATQLTAPVCSVPLAGFAQMFPFNPEVSTYSFFASTCQQERTIAKIRVYPDIFWDYRLAFSLDLGLKRNEPSGQFELETFVKRAKEALFAAGQATRRSSEESKLSVQAQVSRVYDNQSMDLSRDFEESSEKLLPYARVLVELLDFIFWGMCALTGTEINIENNTKINGKWGWEEIAGSPKCQLKCSLTVECKPLLKVKVRQDVTDAVLALLVVVSEGALAPLVTRVKHLRGTMKKGVGKDSGPAYANAEGGIYFTVDAGIDVICKFDGKRVDGAWQSEVSSDPPKGALEMGLACNLKGRAKVKKWGLTLQLRAEINASAKAGLEVERLRILFGDDTLAIAGKFEFTGLVVTVHALIEGEFKTTSGEKKKARSNERTRKNTERSESIAPAPEGGELKRTTTERSTSIGATLDEPGIAGGASEKTVEQKVEVNPETGEDSVASESSTERSGAFRGSATSAEASASAKESDTEYGRGDDGKGEMKSAKSKELGGSARADKEGVEVEGKGRYEYKYVLVPKHTWDFTKSPKRVLDRHASKILRLDSRKN